MARLFADENFPAGIIVCIVDLDFAGQAARIHEAIDARDSLERESVRINRPA